MAHIKTVGWSSLLPTIQVVLKISVELPPAAVASGRSADSLRAQGDPKPAISAATRKWSKEVRENLRTINLLGAHVDRLFLPA